MAEAKVGVIGGTGLYQIEGMTKVEEIKVKTPFGDPSDAITLGEIDGVEVAFLPRHGRGHFITPTELPSKANIYAMKSLGVEYILSVATVGSLQEKIRPLDIVIPDQIIDRTRQRVSTFFGDGIVAHIQFADPFCHVLSQIVYQSALEAGATVHQGGTFIAMEGPAFSTRAESRLYRAWGADIIGMTVLPEARLAREAEICYASIACVTDYDSWHETNETVTVEAILTTMRNNVENAKKTIKLAAGRLPAIRECDCAGALGPAIVTDPALIPDEQKEKLDLLIGKYVRK